MQMKQIEQYHKGIHKKYSKLYVKIGLADTNILADNFQDFIKQIIEENQIPFESDKFYEIIIHCNFLKDESINMKESLYSQVEQLRNELNAVRINQIFVFGNIVNQNPGVKIEMEEKDAAEYNHIFIMPDNDIYERLLYYYKKQMIERSLNDESLTPKTKNKVLKMIEKDYSEECKISKQDIVNYAWAIHVINTKGEDYIWDKRENTLLRFDTEFQIWAQLRFTKIHDERMLEELEETMKSIYLSQFREEYAKLKQK